MVEGVKGAVGRAYQYLYNGILSGEFPLGSPLSEVEIGEALGVSRSPVREALKLMEAEGLVSHFPGRGTFVIDISQRDLEEIFELRIMLELHSLDSACRYMEDNILNTMESNFLRLEADSDRQDYFDANHLLHSSIIAYGGNQRLEKFYHMLSAQIAIVNRISSRDPEHFGRSKEKHLSIIQAIRVRDVVTARETLAAHLEDVRDRTIQAYAAPIAMRKARRLEIQV